MTFHIIYVIAVVGLLFGATILIHELGHFISARLLGMVVEVFSIGFGPAIWKKKIGGVVYQIGCIPVGGYVALPQMDPQPVEPDSNKKDAGTPEDGSSPERIEKLPRLAPWKKIIVALMGAAGNIMLAVLLAWIVYLAGKPSTPAERCAVIGFVEPGSAASAAGILTGDEIIEINGRKVSNWNEVLQENARFEQVALTLKRGGEMIHLAAATEKNMIGLRVVPGLRETSICKVKAVETGSSAETAGVMSGDIIKSFNGVDVLSIDHLIDLVSARPDTKTPLVVGRGGETVSMSVLPRVHPELGRAVIGIRFDPMAFDYDRKVHIRPGRQLKNHATAILRVVRSLVTPKEAKATSEGLGGPFIIIFMFVEMVRRSLITAIWFTCFLNVNLAILNLLPIPILDGGHVLFALRELIFRKPVHPKVIQWLSNFFAGLLITAIVLLSVRDIKRITRITRLFKSAPVQNEPTNNVDINGSPAEEQMVP